MTKGVDTQRAPRIGVVGFAPMFALSGMGVRAAAVIHDLTALGADVVAISVGEHDASAVLSLDTGTVPLSSVTATNKVNLIPRLAKSLRIITPSLDALVIESAMFIPAISLARVKIPVVWDITELEGLHYRRLPLRPRTLTLRGVWRILEEWSARRATIVVPISDEEARWCRQLLPATSDRIVVVEHRVPIPPDFSRRVTEGRKVIVGTAGRPTRLIFLGNISAKHNLESARYLTKELPHLLTTPAHLVLIGPGTELLPTRQQGHLTIECLGRVADLASIIAPTDIGLAPLSSGAGVKTKVLDYLALGCRVVATPVALEGIRDAPGAYSVERDLFPDFLARMLSQQESAAVREARVTSQREWLQAHASPELTTAGWHTVLVRLGLATEGPQTRSQARERKFQV